MSMRNPHHGRGGSRHIGRLRIAAAKILNEAFPKIHVEPEDIQPATGSYRTDWRQDVYRWELFASIKGPGRRVPFCGQCWQSLTDFVRNAKAGGKVEMNNDGDIWAS
jgi:hypothetical protein